MKRTLLRTVLLSTMLAAMLLTPTCPARADLNNWIMGVKAVDTDGNSSAGPLLIGWREGYTNDYDPAEDVGLPPSPPGLGTASAVAYLTPSVISRRDFRAPAVGDSSTKIFKIALFSDDGYGQPIDPIKVRVYAMPYSFPYEGDFTTLTVRWFDGTQYHTRLFTAQDQLAIGNGLSDAGFTFTLPGKTSYDYNMPDLIIIAGVPEPGSAIALLCGLGGLGVMVRRKRL